MSSESSDEDILNETRLQAEKLKELEDEQRRIDEEKLRREEKMKQLQVFITTKPVQS